MADLTMGQRIAEERKKLGISQEGLGEKMGVSRQAISKWEADGAVPEIDKLIQLSKLFGVSVGWLLGVEEAPAQQAETLSEEQLYMIEEIVKKYQPKPAVSKLQLALKAGIAALGVVAMTVLTLASMGVFNRAEDNTAAIDSLRFEMNSQIASLESRIDAAQTAVQTQSPALLADYSLEIASIVSGDRPAAEIAFSAVPNSWQKGDSGTLSIWRAGGKTVQVECTWDGAFLTTHNIMLDAEDGYEFCFTIRHGDGTQEQQVLHAPDIRNLKKTLGITAEVIAGSWSYEDKTLTLNNYQFHIAMPFSGQFYGAIAWEQVDLILTYSDGEEIGRFSLLSAQEEKDPDILASSEIWMERVEINYVDLELSPDAGILLWLYAETNNGLTSMQPADAWTTDSNGRLLAVQAQ